MDTFQNQIKAWKNVLFALFLRELQSKFNDKFGMSWALIEPFMFIFVIAYGRSLISGDDVHTVPVFMFMFIGFLNVMTFTTLIAQASMSIRKSKPLFAFRQVQPIAPVIVTTTLEFAIKIGVILLGILAMYLGHIEGQVNDPILLLTLLLNLFILGFSLALIFAIAASFAPEMDKIKNMLTRPLLFISAVFFSLQDLPKEFWKYFTWNPLLHINELARYACYPSYGTDGVSFAFVQQCTISLLFLALASYHISWKSVLAK